MYTLFLSISLEVNLSLIYWRWLVCPNNMRILFVQQNCFFLLLIGLFIRYLYTFFRLLFSKIAYTTIRFFSAWLVYKLKAIIWWRIGICPQIYVIQLIDYDWFYKMKLVKSPWKIILIRCCLAVVGGQLVQLDVRHRQAGQKKRLVASVLTSILHYRY